MQAVLVFGYDKQGKPHANLDLEKRVDYLDAYCKAVNAALGQKPAPEGKRPWWRWIWPFGYRYQKP